jgi:glycosyltransferase involved in cell wall biosynthesis
MAERIKIFTWHIHGSYLYYLSQSNFDIYIPVNQKKSEGYIGLGTTFPFDDNVHEIPVEAVRDCDFDCILFQTPANYRKDQLEIFSARQQRLPKIYLEHDPPQEIPTNTRHVVDDPEITLVHVTHFNNLMWDNGSTRTTVIDHGIFIPEINYKGTIERGIVVINNLDQRGRRLGLDVFQEVRKHIPLDLIGMDTKKLGGSGEILHPQLPEFISQYRFFFNPIRYTSLGLAVLEAMMAGVPVVGLATTEMVTVIQDGHSGFLSTDVSYLINKMKQLLEDKALAAKLGEEGKQIARARFNIKRFTTDWENLIHNIVTREKFKQPVEVMSEI